MKDFLHHLFLPKESNNHRAKLIHPRILLIISAVFLISSIVIQFGSKNYSSVLGITSNISFEELVSLTNQKRSEGGLEPLSVNDNLSKAAEDKAYDMFSKNYWAHNSPDGTTPWVFIKSSGYDYLYAGENLARGFTTSTDVVDAWMASQGHKENILSKNYKEIGFAIVPGRLSGTETVLVVQMFGSRSEIESQREIAYETSPESNIEEPRIAVNVPMQNTSTVQSVSTNPIINTQDAVKNIGFLIFFGLFILVLVDLIIIKRTNIYRVVAHNVDTLIFFGLIIAIIIMIGRGSIV